MKAEYRFEIKTKNRLLGNFPASMAAIDFVAETTKKKEKLTDEEKEKLKEKLERQLIETKEAMAEAEETTEETEEVVEEEDVEEIEEEDEDRLNVFLRDKTGIYIEERHVKGLLKEFFRIHNFRGYREPINHGVAVLPDGASYQNNDEFKIYLCRDGKPIREPDGIVKRPLQVMSPRGKRSSYKLQEFLDPPVTATFRLIAVDSVARKLFTKEYIVRMGEVLGLTIGLLGDRSLGMGKFDLKITKL